MIRKLVNIIPLSKQLDSIIWGIKQLWIICPRIILFLCLTALLDSTLPAGLAITTRLLINRVSAAISNGTAQLETILIPLLLIFCFIILQSVTAAVKNYLSQIFRDIVNLKISCKVMTHASTHDITFFENSDNQDMLTRVNQNTANHLFLCFINSLNLSSDIVKLISLSVILFLIEPLIALVIIPLFLPYLFFKIRLSKDRYAVHSSQTLKRRWTNYFVRLLTQPEQVAEIKILGIAPFFLNKFKKLMDGFNSQEKNLYRRGLVGNLVFSAIANLTIFLILCRIILRVIGGALTIGDVVIFIGTSANLRNLLENVSNLLSDIHEHSSYISNFRNFQTSSINPVNDSGNVHASLDSGAIELHNVSFTYPGAKSPTLRNISIKINPGETIALVGENAAGKTTLAKLIAGLYKPDSGLIILDGKDIHSYAPTDLHRKISFVFQNFGRFEASVSDNIAVGNWRELINNEKLIENIAHKVNLYQVVQKYPQGFNTLIGKQFGNYNPSGGQWQYIAIARALAKESVILILDEPTANLDVNREFDLFNRFKELAAGRTTVLISHRFSTVKISDRIIVLNDKEIVENGTHKELLQKRGAYAAMFRMYEKQMNFETRE